MQKMNFWQFQLSMRNGVRKMTVRVCGVFLIWGSTLSDPHQSRYRAIRCLRYAKNEFFPISNSFGIVGAQNDPTGLASIFNIGVGLVWPCIFNIGMDLVWPLSIEISGHLSLKIFKKWILFNFNLVWDMVWAKWPPGSGEYF